jgi:hypothetical protein
MLLIQKRRNAEGATTRDAALSAMMAEVSPRLVSHTRYQSITHRSVDGWVCGYQVRGRDSPWGAKAIPPGKCHTYFASMLIRRCAASLSPALRRAGGLPRVVATRSLSTESSATAPSEPKKPNLVAELERLQTQLPWWQSAFLQMSGTFSEDQWQAAAGGDMYVNVLEQSRDRQPDIVRRGALPDRFYTQLQVRGLHCWLAHVRLRQQPKESFATLYREMMEHVWDQAALDLTRDFGFGFIEMSKHLKNAQLSWHGSCKALDDALETDAPREAMAAVLLRNMYVDAEGESLLDEAGEHLPEAQEGSLWLADYLMEQRAHLASVADEDVLKGRITWANRSSTS